MLEHSPYLEAFRAKGQDVLLLTDPIDEFMLPSLREYKGKKLQGRRSRRTGGGQEREKDRRHEEVQETVRASQERSCRR